MFENFILGGPFAKDSLKEDYADFSVERKAKILYEDSKITLPNDYMNYNLLSATDLEKYKSLRMDTITAEQVRNTVAMLRKYDGIYDYQIVCNLVKFAKKLNMDEMQFIKTFMFDVEAKSTTASDNGKKSSKLIVEKHKVKDTKPAQKDEAEKPVQHKENKSIVEKEMVKDAKPKKIESSSVNVNVEAAKEAEMITNPVSKIIDNCNRSAAKNKSDRNKPIKNNQNNKPVMPGMNIDQKIQLIKNHIKLAPGVELPNEAHLDALIRLIQGPMLKTKLKEYDSVCDPTYPELMHETNVNFDKSNYNFAFSTASKIEGKKIMILYNTNVVNTPVGPGNNLSIELV